MEPTLLPASTRGGSFVSAGHTATFSTRPAPRARAPA